MAKGWADFSAVARPFRNRNFALYTAGNAVSNTGTWIQRLAVGWLAWKLTESAFWVAAVSFADLFPVVILGMFGGVLADRVSRIKVVRICQVVQALQAIALFFLVAFDLITIELLFAFTLILGASTGFDQPARQSLVYSLVPREDLTSAVAINSIIFNTARFIGPAIAGVVIAAFGLAWAFAINAVSFLATILALSLMKISAKEHVSKHRMSVLADLLLGFRYTVRHQVIGRLILYSLALSLLVRPLNELLPAITELLFEHGASGLAILTSARGVGALLAGLLLAKRTQIEGLTRHLVYSMLAGVVSVFLLLATGNIWVGAIALALFGFAMSTTGTGCVTMIQVTVDNRLRGRVLSLNGLIMRGVPSLGAVVMGWIADRAGLYWPLAVGAGLFLVIFLSAVRWEKRVRAIADREPGSHRGRE
ncbi:MAG: MFS transporter [Alphaproteobacteria bacterium]|nr:MFS transporter [Alphaproteobacteria bacterium]